MNSVLLFDGDKIENELFELNDARALHIREHLKLNSGDLVHTTLVGQGLGKSQILKCQADKILLKTLEHDQRLPSKLKVSVGLSRPPTMKKILEHGTTLGIGAFELFQAQLSEKSYATSKVLTSDSIQELLCLGLSQSRHYAHMPEVEVCTKWNLDTTTPTFFLDANSSLNLANCGLNPQHPCHFLIGPERGWTAAEREALLAAGVSPISLAPTTLRVEHALFALMGQWHLLPAL